MSKVMKGAAERLVSSAQNEAVIWHYMDAKTVSGYGPWVRYEDHATLRQQIVEEREKVARIIIAAQALGAMPEGYCFCSKDRTGDDSKKHEPECADLRAALSTTEAKTDGTE